MTRIKGIDVKYIIPQTKKEQKNENIPTQVLIKYLKEENFWKHRAKIAQILGQKEERTVPEALLECINLEVRKNALESFAAITGFMSIDVLDCELAEAWWQQNKTEVDKNLKDLQTVDSIQKSEKR